MRVCDETVERERETETETETETERQRETKRAFASYFIASP